MPNKFAGQFVNLGASKIVELFTSKAENTASADDRDVHATDKLFPESNLKSVFPYSTTRLILPEPSHDWQRGP